MARCRLEDYIGADRCTAARDRNTITGSDVNMIGYCIGGTLTVDVACVLARKGEKFANAITYFAALVDFNEAGDMRDFLSDESVAHIEKEMQDKGVLAAAKWRIRSTCCVPTT